MGIVAPFAPLGVGIRRKFVLSSHRGEMGPEDVCRVPLAAVRHGRARQTSESGPCTVNFETRKSELEIFIDFQNLHSTTLGRTLYSREYPYSKQYPTEYSYSTEYPHSQGNTSFSMTYPILYGVSLLHCAPYSTS